MKVDMPSVSDDTKRIYEDYRNIGLDGPKQPATLDIEIYKSYVEQKYM